MLFEPFKLQKSKYKNINDLARDLLGRKVIVTPESIKNTTDVNSTLIQYLSNCKSEKEHPIIYLSRVTFENNSVTLSWDKTVIGSGHTGSVSRYERYKRYTDYGEKNPGHIYELLKLKNGFNAFIDSSYFASTCRDNELVYRDATVDFTSIKDIKYKNIVNWNISFDCIFKIQMLETQLEFSF